MTSAKTISESGYTESNGGQGFSLSFAGDTIQLTIAPPGIFVLFCFPCVCLFPPKMTFSRMLLKYYTVVVVQPLSRVRLFETPWATAHQAPLSFTISWSLLRFSELVMLSNHLILCLPLLLSSIFYSIRVFSNELALHVRWPKYWSFSFSISSSNGYSRLISFRIDWFDLVCSPRDSRESSPAPQFKSINSSELNFLYGPTLTFLHDYWNIT